MVIVGPGTRCRNAYACDRQTDFRTDIGQLYVQGPRHDQLHACVSGKDCKLGVFGFDLDNSSLLIAEECGAEVEPWPHNRGRYPMVEGFPDDGIAVAEEDPNSITEYFFGEKA